MARSCVPGTVDRSGATERARRVTGTPRVAERPTRMQGDLVWVWGDAGRAALVEAVFGEMHDQLRQDEHIWSARDASIDRRTGDALTTVRRWLSSFC